MKSAIKFTLIVFAPLLAPLALPAPCLAGNCVLVGLIFVADPTSLPAPEVAGYCLWSLAPILLIGAITSLGLFCHWLDRRWRAKALTWFCVWLTFTIFSFLGIWFGFSLLTSVGASDYSAQTFFTWTASVALALTLIAQLGVVPWLWIVARLVDRAIRAKGVSHEN